MIITVIIISIIMFRGQCQHLRAGPTIRLLDASDALFLSQQNRKGAHFPFSSEQTSYFCLCVTCDQMSYLEMRGSLECLDTWSRIPRGNHCGERYIFSLPPISNPNRTGTLSDFQPQQKNKHKGLLE